MPGEERGTPEPGQSLPGRAMKYMEFYDTRQRELCEHFLQENGEKGFC